MFTSWLTKLPKAELHLHLEGTLTPNMMWSLAKKNHIQLPYQHIEDIEQAYHFKNLNDFLALYYQGCAVLVDEDDFYQLTWAYLCDAKKQGIVHVEPFFDPQTHTARGVAFSTVIQGITRALSDAEQKLGITSCLILCFLRHLSQDDAWKTWKHAQPYLKYISAVGLDSSEKEHPPTKFKDIFAAIHTQGIKTVAHAGEEGSSDYIKQALNLLHIQRIDHGIKITDDVSLLKKVIDQQIPLTVCPLSNIALGVYSDIKQHPILTLLDQGACVTVNSDDPAYFGGNLNQNFEALRNNLSMTDKQLIQLCHNSIQASFMAKRQKQRWNQKIKKIYEQICLTS